MNKIRISKETAIPSTITANTIYLVSVGVDKVEVYISNLGGDALRRVITEGDVDAAIDARLNNLSSFIIVADIAERDALTWTANGKVYVEDATDDPTVDSGGAEYIYKVATQTYIKATEAESLDMIVDWFNIQNRPASTPAQIDAAVTVSHTHANKTELDQLGQDADGDLTYGGEKVANTYINVAW